MSDVPLLTPEALRGAMESGTQVVDLRPGSIYAKEHIPDSVNLPYARSGFAETAEYFLKKHIPVLLVTESAPLAHAAHAALTDRGFQVDGHLGGGLSTWKQSGGETAAIGETTADRLAQDLESDVPPRIIDVREAWEFEARHIEGAELLPLSSFTQHVEALPKDQRLVFVCASGGRSGEAVQFLYRLGYRNVENLVGGMAAWMAGRQRA